MQIAGFIIGISRTIARYRNENTVSSSMWLFETPGFPSPKGEEWIWRELIFCVCAYGRITGAITCSIFKPA